MSEEARFIFTKDNVNNNKVKFALALLKGLNLKEEILNTHKEKYFYQINTKYFKINTYYGGVKRLEYYKQENSSFSRVFEFKLLFDIFTDPTNQTPEELTLFNLEYGVPWITELRQEDLVQLF